ncbi:DMT family transporter [Modicisalibacter coralii]|uniref:DMT family transporter n=1 Tax=Modicisalibacter coralii TaxID=2304602 RepID=UPI00100B6101|nr:DMT family transporter [Halomonas coralii]
MPHLRAYLLLLLVVVIFTGNILVGKALSSLPPLTISFGRVAIALLVMLPLGWYQARRAWPAFRRHWKPLTGLALSGVAFFNALIYLALGHTSPTNVAILESTIPVVTLLFSFLLFGERFRGVQWLGVALSLAGAVAVITCGGAAGFSLDGVNRGDAVMLLAVLVWVGYSLLVKSHMAKFPRYGGLLVMLVIANLVMGPLALIENLLRPAPLTISPSQWLGLAYLGIFPSVVALLLYSHAIGEVGPTRSAVFLNLLPVFTMLGAWWLLGERIQAVQLVGSLVVIGGVLLTTRARA